MQNIYPYSITPNCRLQCLNQLTLQAYFIKYKIYLLLGLIQLLHNLYWLDMVQTLYMVIEFRYCNTDGTSPWTSHYLDDTVTLEGVTLEQQIFKKTVRDTGWEIQESKCTDPNYKTKHLAF